VDSANINSDPSIFPGTSEIPLITKGSNSQSKSDSKVVDSVETTLDSIDSILDSQSGQDSAQAGLKKLIIQIPCYNEAETLGITLDALPRQVAGVETVEWLIIDDGSKDRTIEVAKAHGVDHIVSFTHNKGLASAFQAGIEACLRLGADVIVNKAWKLGCPSSKYRRSSRRTKRLSCDST